MEHSFHISDDQYTKLAVYAARRKQTPEKLFQDWVKAVAREVEQPPAPNDQLTTPKPSARQEEALLNSPLLHIAGMFAIGEPGWADKHDEYLAESYLDDHASSN